MGTQTPRLGVLDRAPDGYDRQTDRQNIQLIIFASGMKWIGGDYEIGRSVRRCVSVCLSVCLSVYTLAEICTLVSAF